jgi:hypothetical protein
MPKVKVAYLPTAVAVLFLLTAEKVADFRAYQEQINDQATYIAQLENRIPDPCEIQRKLKHLGNPRYDPGRIDGDPGTETRRAWLNWTFDNKAEKYFVEEE